MQSAHDWQDEGNAGNISPHLLWGIWLFWMYFLVQPATLLLQLPSSFAKVVRIGDFALFVGLYLWVSWHEAYRLTRATPLAGGSERRWWAAVGIMMVLAVVICLTQGSQTLGIFIYISACIAARLTIRQTIGMVTSLLAIILLLAAITGSDFASLGQILFIVPAVGFIVHFFGRSIRTNQDLRVARREIARLAVSEERLRFARDLHDLLGHTLSLIALKSELAGQLIPEEPIQAQREVHDIEAAARTALQEVREAVAGYRQSTLASELQRARELLAAAGIQCTIQDDATGLSAPCEKVLTWVVREAVTNVMRHSRAQHCSISLTHEQDEVRLTVTDDGRGDGCDAQATPAGNGLRGISERVTAQGGSFDAGPAEDQGFRLVVSVPMLTDRDLHPPSRQPTKTKGAIR